MRELITGTAHPLLSLWEAEPFSQDKEVKRQKELQEQRNYEVR